MSSFDSELADLVQAWTERGASTESIVRAIVYEIAKNGPAEKSVPEIVTDVLHAEDEIIAGK